MAYYCVIDYKYFVRLYLRTYFHYSLYTNIPLYVSKYVQKTDLY